MTAQKCIAKLGEQMRECGLLTEYVDERQASAEGLLYAGWRHLDRNIIDHHAVPESLIGCPTSRRSQS